MTGLGRAGLVLACGLLAVSGCRSQPVAAPAAPTLVPWTDAVPRELATRAVPAAPRCRPAQLRVDGPGFLFQSAAGGAGGGTGTATLRNTGPAPCRLEGRPAVRFVGAARAPGQRQAALPSDPPAFPKLLPPAATLRALAPGAAATLTIDWRNWCVPGARTGRPLVPPRAARLTLPADTGSLDVPYSSVTTCEDPSAPSTVGVRPFQPAALAEPGGWVDVRVQATVRTLTGGDPPLHGRRGELVRFAVELRNPNRQATIRFDRCPVVAELLAPAGRTEAHQLDCAAAAPIPPGAATLFEMRIRVPATAPPGPNGLLWVLDAAGSRPLEVVSRLIVDA